MALEADVNYGFKGEVTSAVTPIVLGRGVLYSVEGPLDLQVTSGGGGDRAVSVREGSAWGDGVLSTWNTGAVLNGASVSSGSRWDTVVIRREWTPESSPTGTATLMLLQGSSTRAISSSRTTDAGVTTSDQPIALVRFQAGQTAVQEIVDLRTWAGAGGGMVARDEAALGYLTAVGTQVAIGDSLYTRRLTAGGAAEWFVANPTDKSLGPRPSVTIGRGSPLAYGATDEWLVGSEAALTNYMYNPASVGLTGVGGNTQGNPSRISVGQAGLYSYGFRIAVRAPAAFRANASVGVFGAGAIDPSSQVDVTSIDHPGGNIVRYLSGGDTRWIRAGTGLGLRLDVNVGIEVVNWRIWATWLGN